VNAQEIKEVLRLIRPALFAMFGQQVLVMKAYSFIDICPGEDDSKLYSGRFQVKGKEMYVAVLDDSEVISLGEGTLNL
jgi:hypothetical protein